MMMWINKSFVQRKRENERETSSSATVIPGAIGRGWMESGEGQMGGAVQVQMKHQLQIKFGLDSNSTVPSITPTTRNGF